MKTRGKKRNYKTMSEGNNDVDKFEFEKFLEENKIKLESQSSPGSKTSSIVSIHNTDSETDESPVKFSSRVSNTLNTTESDSDHDFQPSPLPSPLHSPSRFEPRQNYSPNYLDLPSTSSANYSELHQQLDSAAKINKLETALENAQVLIAKLHSMMETPAKTKPSPSKASSDNRIKDATKEKQRIVTPKKGKKVETEVSAKTPTSKKIPKQDIKDDETTKQIQLLQYQLRKIMKAQKLASSSLENDEDDSDESDALPKPTTTSDKDTDSSDSDAPPPKKTKKTQKTSQKTDDALINLLNDSQSFTCRDLKTNKKYALVDINITEENGFNGSYKKAMAKFIDKKSPTGHINVSMPKPVCNLPDTVIAQMKARVSAGNPPTFCVKSIKSRERADGKGSYDIVDYKWE